jgi:malate synthase
MRARRKNQMEGQVNLRDAVRRNISFRDPKSGKTYQLKPQVPCPAVVLSVMHQRLQCPQSL